MCTKFILHTFIQQGCIKLIKSVSKNIDNYLQNKYFFINLFQILFIKESWQKCISFHKNMKQHNGFQNW